MITKEQLTRAFPNAKLTKLGLTALVSNLQSALQQLSGDVSGNNVNRWAAFLAQTAHESGQFNVVKENLNYSEEGLRKTFGKYFPRRPCKVLRAST